MSESCEELSEELSVELSAPDKLSVLELVMKQTLKLLLIWKLPADLEVAASEGVVGDGHFLQCPFSCLGIVPLSGRSRHLS